MNLKRVIINLLPYGFVRYSYAKKYREGNIIKYNQSLPNIEDSESKFKNIVSIQGFGFSGSGAVVDYLREFSNCLVLGSIDTEGSVAKGKRHVNGEIDFLRHAGGLFEFENYVNDNNPFSKDALIKRFILLVNSESIFHEKRMEVLINRFYNQLIDFEIDTRGHDDFNWHLANILSPDSKIKVMKPLCLDDYRDLCRRLLTSMLNLFHKEKYSYLVLDQFCSDGNFDFKKYRTYIPNLKIIFVYRDPRDTYAYSIMKNITWIPHDNVEKFVKWYKNAKYKLDFYSRDFLLIRFEDLVMNYEKTTKMIVEYLDMQMGFHTYPHSCFLPEESAKNIAIWKRLEGKEDDLEIIKTELSEYCYEM